MLGKKGSNPKDDFDFDFGGSDELFSLDDPFGSKEEKPPKGVKGYFKNVLKSVKNVGVAVGNQYLPDVKYLIDDLKEDDSDNPPLREQARLFKQKAKDYAKMSKDVAKDLGKDIKTRIKSGYFFKSESDSYGDMDFGFDDFGGDSELGGLVDNFGESDDSTPAPDSTETGSIPETTKNNLSLITAKSAKASTLASMRMHDDTINATLGATQYHIETENVRFNQSMLIESEHHRQKMIVMKNIASNVGKLVKQNNVSLKAQMEYSLKSLAFTNDVATMVKEIRDVQWKALVPKKDEEDEVNYGDKAKAFGNGFNKKAWLSHFKSRSSSEFAGGIFDYFGMMKEAMGSMDGFGIKPIDMVKSMIGGSISEGAINAILPEKLKNSLQRINRAAVGAPNAINNILGRIGQEGLSEDSILSKALGKMGTIGNTLKNTIKNFASYAHMEDMVVSNTGKYTLKNPEDAHPFDNLAHKVLTEVIPKQLSMIEAGVNNSEEKFFDYSSNSFKTISSIKNRINKERQNVLEYSEGYSAASNHTMDTLSSADSLKNIDLDVNKLNSQLIKNLFNAQTGLKNEDIVRFYKRDENGKLTNEIDLDSDLTNKILNDVDNYSKQELTEQNKKDIVSEFIKGLRNLEKENPEEFINLQNGAGTYAQRLSEANVGLEKEYGRFGNSIAFDTFTKDEQVDRQIKRSKRLADLYKGQLDDLSVEKGGDKLFRKQKRTQYLNELSKIKDLNEYKEGKVGIVNEKADEDDINYSSNLYNQFKNITGKNEDEIEEKRAELIKNSTKVSIDNDYEMKELKNTSTNSIVNNIYKLLLDGLIVYPQKSMSKDVEKRYNLRNNVLDSIRKENNEKLTNELFEKFNSKRTNEELASENLKNLKRSREEIYEKSLVQEKLENLPGVGRLFKKLSSLMNTTVNSPISTVADFVEEKLYGVNHNSDQQLKEAGMNVLNKGKETFEKAKKTKVGKIVTKVGGKSISFIKKALGPIGNIKVNGVSLNDKIAEIKDSELSKKLKEAKTTEEKAKILLEYGGSELNEFKEKLKDFSNKVEEKGIKATAKEAGMNVLNKGKETFEKAKKTLSNHPDGRKEGSLQDQKLDKQEEKEAEQKESQTKSLATIATMLSSFFKNGFKLDKSTMKEFEENNDELKEGLNNVADSSSEKTSGLLGKVNDLIDKSGLGDTKAGQAVKGVLSKTQGVIDTTKGTLDKVKNSKLGQKLINSAAGTTVAGIGGTAKGIFKGSFTALKHGGVSGLKKHVTRAISKGAAKTAAKGAAKTAAKSATKNKGLIKKFLDMIKKFLDMVFKNPKYAKVTGKSAVSTIIKNFTRHLPTIFGKIASKITSAIAFLSTGVGALVKFGVGFANGARNVRETLGLGNDMKPTGAMIGICSLASGLDLVLSAIPTLIAKLAGYKNFAQWLYSMIGSKAEKEAIDRYKKYCSMKAAIYGIKDSNALISYQNRDTLDKGGRALLHIATLGLTKSNDEKDASMLGFSSVKIFKYWKENKYDKLEEIRKDVAEKYGGLKVVEKTEVFTADKNGDGNISEDEQEKADEQQKRIQNQQDFRIDFLKQARSWVIDNKLAWLNSTVTIEEFNKRTGQNATKIKSTKDKLKGAGKAVLKYGAAALIAGPIGVVAQKGAESVYKTGKEKMAKDGTKVTVGSNTIAAKQVKGIKTFGVTMGTGIAAIATKSKIPQILSNVKNGVSNGVKSCIDTISNFFKKLLENAKIKAIKGINVIKTLSSKLIDGIKNEASKSPSFAADLATKTLMFTVMLPATIIRAVTSFISGRANPEKYLKIPIEEKNEKIKMAGGLVALINTIMPYANQVCMNQYGKTIRKLVFDIVMKDSSEDKSDTYTIEKAKIIGLTPFAMKAYEEKLNESSFSKKAKNFISNIFGGGADRTDAKLCGFSDVTVFKFWREEKYEPLRDLEESIAHKFGDLDDLRSEVPKDSDAQAKFRQAYLREAKNYVKERGLEWLTYKTTKEELLERKKNKTLYIKSDKQVQKQKAEKEAEKPGFFKSIKNFFTSSNRDTRGNAKQSYQNNIGKINRNYTDIENSDTKAMTDDLQKQYKYDEKAMSVMKQASNSIKSFWKSISPNFYGDQPKAEVSSDPNIKDDKVYAGNGGPGDIVGTTQGLITKVRDRVIDYGQKAISKTRNEFVDKSNEVIGNLKDLSKKISRSSGKDTYDMSGKTPKATVMNSIVTDFAKNFGNELNKRLDILEEMHKESLRHNKVSEDFFIAALRMLQMIAGNTKNNSNPTMNSQLDSLINSLTR